MHETYAPPILDRNVEWLRFKIIMNCLGQDKMQLLRCAQTSSGVDLIYLILLSHVSESNSLLQDGGTQIISSTLNKHRNP